MAQELSSGYKPICAKGVHFFKELRKQEPEEAIFERGYLTFQFKDYAIL